MFYGPGAGGDPTASAVLGDIVAVARHRVVRRTRAGGVHLRRPADPARWARPPPATTSASTSLDRPGVLAQVATAFADHEVSIETVRQQLLKADPDGAGDRRASLVVVTHTATDAALSATVDALAALPTVRGVTSVMRVEGE